MKLEKIDVGGIEKTHKPSRNFRSKVLSRQVPVSMFTRMFTDNLNEIRSKNRKTANLT